MDNVHYMIPVERVASLLTKTLNKKSPEPNNFERFLDFCLAKLKSWVECTGVSILLVITAFMTWIIAPVLGLFLFGPLGFITGLIFVLTLTLHRILVIQWAMKKSYEP